MNAHFNIDHHAGRSIKIDGKDFLFFGGTNYLGISGHDGFQENLIQALKKYGTSHGASRNNNLRLSIFEEFENYFAGKYGFEAAAVTSSGLLAGQLAMASLPPQVIFAPGTHPAVKPHKKANPSIELPSDFNFSENIADIAKKIKVHFTIASNAVDNLFCTEINFDWINKLPEEKNIHLLIDYSHGIGIMDLNANVLKVKNKFNVIIAASLAKAIGIPAGIVLGNKSAIQKIKNNPLFIGASPASPAFLEAFLRSEKIYEEQRGKLFQNIEFFNQYNTFPFRSSLNHPTYFSSENIFKELFEKGMFVSSFSYPSPNSPPIMRVVLSAVHTQEDLEKLIDNLIKIK